MKKTFTLLPIIGLILGAVVIASEIKLSDPVPPGQMLSGAMVNCVKTALQKRETTLFSTFTTYQNNALVVLATRKTALFAAWDKTTKSGVKTAISAAWKTYASSMSDLKSTLHTARDTAWSLYKTDVKSCKGNLLIQNVDTSSEKSEQ
ncbi:MAG: hypothetical protein NT085_01905 [candidate division SR1 bacterium]|nr:hypothetical protein [candidate division SR1 bacterium]